MLNTHRPTAYKFIGAIWSNCILYYILDKNKVGFTE